MQAIDRFATRICNRLSALALLGAEHGDFMAISGKMFGHMAEQDARGSDVGRIVLIELKEPHEGERTGFLPWLRRNIST